MSIEVPNSRKQQTEIEKGSVPASNKFGPAPEFPYKESKDSLDKVIDKLKTPESTKALKGNRRLWIALGGGAAALVIAGGLTAWGISTANNQPEQPTTTGQEGPENPGPVVEEPDTEVEPETGGEVEVPPFDATVLQDDLVEMNIFATLSPEEQSRIHEMNEQDVQTYRANQARGEQLAFGTYVIETNMPIVEYRLSNAIESKDLANISDPNSPEGIFQQYQLNLVALSTLKKSDGDGGITFDLDTALKASSVLRTGDGPTGENSIQAFDKIISSWAEYVSTTTDMVYEPWNIEESKILENGDIAYVYTQGDNPKAFAILTPETFQNVHNEEQTVYTPSLLVNENDPRFRDSLENLN